VPRVSIEGFVGPANAQQSRTLDVERTDNLYIAPAAPGVSPKGPGALACRPAMVPWTVFPDSPIRGLFAMNGRLWAVGGTTYAEIMSDGTFGTGHPVATDNRPVSIITNGTFKSGGKQNLIVSANKGYVDALDTDAFVQITDPNWPTIVHQAEYMDGYGLVGVGNASIRFQWSKLFDFTSWPALNFAERSTAMDSIGALIRLQRTLLVFGTDTMEPWYDVGQGNTVFAPTGSVLVEQGISMTFTMLRADNTVYWVGTNADGHRLVYRLDGMTPRRVSTFAVEQALQRWDVVQQFYTYAIVFQLEGHSYYALICPTDTDGSFVYDITLDRWYQWGHWDPTAGIFRPWRAMGHAIAFERCLVGDYKSGTIFELRTDTYADTLPGGV
jgi:hypothetical protein